MSNAGRHKTIVTLGPSTLDSRSLRRIQDRGVDYVRINLSHTPTAGIEKTVSFVLENTSVPLILDTEGSQVRTGSLGRPRLELKTGTAIRLFDHEVACDESTLYLRPLDVFQHFRVGDLISVDFDTVLLRVDDLKPLDVDRYIVCTVLTGGAIGNNKAVTIENQTFALPALSDKDLTAIEIAKKHGVTGFTLSFMDSAADVMDFRARYPEASVISKIETRKGVENLRGIVEVSDGILIDRGDLSREIPFERIPFAQKFIIRTARSAGKPVYVATNFLDTMMSSLKPSRAELNDIVNTLIDGADGLVLAAETAIGKHPIETIGLLNSIYSLVQPMRAAVNERAGDRMSDVGIGPSFLTGPSWGQSLIKPHGGKLLNSVGSSLHDDDLKKLPRLRVELDELMDAEQIALGSFSPLGGFMNEDEVNAVLDTMRLPSGVVWPMPIILQVDRSDFIRLRRGDKAVLEDVVSGESIAVLDVESLYSIDLEKASRQWFGTASDSHPGVLRLKKRGPFIVGGAVRLIRRLSSPFKQHEFTPEQTRRIFESRGWTRIAGFHTRNPVHRSHEYIQLQALERARCDGLFVHPVVGTKKAGDFTSEIIVESYEMMIRSFYPTDSAVFGTFATYSRYAGPREALFTAICRKNFGCSHFIVGRDHTGVGSQYDSKESHRVFDLYPEVEIQPVFFNAVGFDPSTGSYAESSGQGDESSLRLISGTNLREIIEKDELPPSWAMRPEIAEAILRRKRTGQKIFV